MQHFRPSLHPSPFPPEEIFILGAGRFGYIAAKRLSRLYPDARYTVVDAEAEKLERIRSDFGLPVRVHEAASFLKSFSVAESAWIIPAVPVHLAFEWLTTELDMRGKADPLPVPQAVDSQIPNPFRTPGGTVYSSFATFLCPDSCNEPDAICTHTGKPRQGELFELLSRIEVPGFEVVVIRSFQLAPGVGGYPMNRLKEALNGISGKAGSYLIGTSCRCHGVIDCLEFEIPDVGRLPLSGVTPEAL